MTEIPIGESQNVEYKEAWRDDFLAWICGFANAQGGRIYLGVDDEGKVVGLADSKRLMEDIPNKIATLLGIVADVNLLTSADGKEYMEIVVEPSNVPISYRGAYHYRSGSTKQELRGAALQQFILKKMGRTWDDMAEPHATIEMIDRKAVDYFLRHAIDAGRAEPEQRNDDTATVLESLRLIDTEGHLTYAAILLFGKDPQRFFPSAVFRIGRFGKDEADLIYQDSIEGNILQMADKVVSILRAKYLISPISYKGMQRLERLEIPEEALREMLYNAIVHKWYGGVHTQMKIYDDHIELWNDGRLPEALAGKDLKAKHASHPRNKLIASVFYRAGLIETWGRGIYKVCAAFRKAGLEEPTWQEYQGGMLTTIPRGNDGDEQVNDTVNNSNDTVNDTDDPINGPNNGPDDPINDPVNDSRDPVNDPDDPVNLSVTEKDILRLLKENPYATYSQLGAQLSKSNPTIKRMLKKLREANMLVRRGSDKTGYWEIVEQKPKD